MIADLVGKGGHMRTVPIPLWVKATVDAWIAAGNITHGTVFRAINKAGRLWADGMPPKVIRDIVLLAHVSIQTTERYLGCKQRLRCAVNDHSESSRTPLELRVKGGYTNICPCRLSLTANGTMTLVRR